MKKISLAVLMLVIVALFQNCKKSSTDTTSATTTYTLQASVNTVTWTPDTLSANITYNAAANTKTFNFTGTYQRKRLNCAVTVNNATAGNSFPLNSYLTDAAGTTTMIYSEQRKDDSGNYVFVPVSAAGDSEGTINVTSVNSASSTITGTFSFSNKKNNYDSNGNVISVTNTVVSGGTFTSMPYTYVTN